MKSKKIFIASATSFILAILTFPVTLLLGPIFCEKGTSGVCDVGDSVFGMISAAIITGILLLLSLTFVIIGLIFKIKE